ncbi:hypothetical protein QUF84_13265 [Fictibacillus enclensis]|uniref:hypothetical protein n=1 Tax=Fictibacillus enclensis TaxID=1017270 RepID=UPI0025A1A4DD|nr:hypothetical protein [Fictibacillus enclensis]MDM5338190.1 hypothetical protein [Fictibacillus enclensis]
MHPSIGDVYTAYVRFKKTKGPGVFRPVLVTNIQNISGNTYYTFAVITTSEPDDPPTRYDKNKAPIVDWETAPYTGSSLGTRTIHEHVLKPKPLDTIGVRGFLFFVLWSVLLVKMLIDHILTTKI